MKDLHKPFGDVVPLDEMLKFIEEFYVPVDERDVVECEDGHYEIEVPGFGQEDVDVTVREGLVSFIFCNDNGDCLELDLEIPKTVSDINLTVDKGILSFTLTHNPCNININIG